MVLDYTSMNGMHFINDSRSAKFGMPSLCIVVAVLVCQHLISECCLTASSSSSAS